MWDDLDSKLNKKCITLVSLYGDNLTLYWHMFLFHIM
jgi:hypothetical protein